MTTQDARTDTAGEAGGFSAEEAERLAARFRPIWDLDEGELAAADATTRASSALAVGGADVDLSGAAPLQAAPSSREGLSLDDVRDTAVDGVPAIAAGATAPGRTSPDGTPAIAAAQDAAAQDAAAAAKAPSKAAEAPAAGAPRKSRRGTMMGLGGETTAAVAAANAPSPSPAAAVAKADDGARATEKAPEAKPRPKPVALEPVSPMGASYSRADDPVELPVEKSSKTWLLLGVAAVGLAAIVGGLMMSGGDEAPTKPQATAPAAAKPAPTVKPAPTNTTSPVATAEAPTPTVTAPPATTAEPSEAPKPTAEAPKPAVTTSPKPTATAAAPKPTATAAAPKPTAKPTSGGGIIRDAPF